LFPGHWCPRYHLIPRGGMGKGRFWQNYRI